MTNDEPMVEARALTRRFDDVLAVCNVSFAVPRGHVLALLGQNGAGKTTTLQMLLGALAPTRGEARLFGESSRCMSSATRARVGYMSEGCALYGWMRVRECANFQRPFYPRFDDRLFRAIVDAFRLRETQRVRELSRGQRAGLNLALILATGPEVLLLDDPGMGLDPMARRLLLEGMLHFAQDARATIVFSSHLLADVERVADDVAILDRGALRVCGSVELFSSKVTQFAVRFAGVPPTVLPIKGLLTTTRLSEELRLTVANEDAHTADGIRALGATTVERVPLSFEDAVIAYLSDRGETSVAWASAEGEA